MHTASQLREVAAELNTRPRQILPWATPYATFSTLRNVPLLHDRSLWMLPMPRRHASLAASDLNTRPVDARINAPATMRRVPAGSMRGCWLALPPGGHQSRPRRLNSPSFASAYRRILALRQQTGMRPLASPISRTA